MGKEVCLSRTKLEFKGISSNTVSNANAFKIPLISTQFPARLRLTTTINKTQEQTSSGKVGIGFETDCFAHIGQLYVALSRSTVYRCK